jgi:PPM family protein phosphatase
MAQAETCCPACGRPTGDEPTCDHCGHEPPASGWLETGQVRRIRVEPERLDLDAEADEVEIDLEMVEMWEVYDTRRVLLARPTSVEGDDAQELLEDVSFVVEQDDAHIVCDDEVLPEAWAQRVRRPLFRDEEQGRLFSVYDNESGLAFDELVEVAGGQLNLVQIRGLFEPVLEAIAELHDDDLLHLRLTPWTLRMRDSRDDMGLPLGFLRETMQEESFDDAAGLEEDTFSEPLEAEVHNEFMTGDAAEKTRNDLPPLGGGVEFPEEPELAGVGATSSVFITDSESAIGSAVDDEGLEVVFDAIEGFFAVDGDFDEVPVVRGFSPPEMMGRARAQIGVGCDVFNLGMLLYFLVAGQLPPVSVYTRHTPALPARNLRPTFPPGLQAVIGRATRPDPKERYPSVDALHKAFNRACEVIEQRAREQVEDPPRMRLAVDTHVGIAKGRRNPVNQDTVFGQTSDDHRFALVVVADGVSTASYGSGDLASNILAEEAARAWEELLPGYLMDDQLEATDAIQRILNRANNRIVDYVNERFLPFRGGPHEVMGTTALVALVHDGMVTLGTLGDSRVYLQRGEAFEQLTIDHNLWTLSIVEGVPADNALAMSHGDALARCLGTFIVENERLEAVDPNPDIFQFPVCKGDTLLLTTDGLVDFAAANMLAAEDKIHQMLVSEPEPALACLELILVANRGGGGDNIGVGIVKFV